MSMAFAPQKAKHNWNISHAAVISDTTMLLLDGHPVFRG